MTSFFKSTEPIHKPTETSITESCGCHLDGGCVCYLVCLCYHCYNCADSQPAIIDLPGVSLEKPISLAPSRTSVSSEPSKTREEAGLSSSCCAGASKSATTSETSTFTSLAAKPAIVAPMPTKRSSTTKRKTDVQPISTTKSLKPTFIETTINTRSNKRYRIKLDRGELSRLLGVGKGGHGLLDWLMRGGSVAQRFIVFILQSQRPASEFDGLFHHSFLGQLSEAQDSFGSTEAEADILTEAGQTSNSARLVDVGSIQELEHRPVVPLQLLGGTDQEQRETGPAEDTTGSGCVENECETTTESNVSDPMHPSTATVPPTGLPSREPLPIAPRPMPTVDDTQRPNNDQDQIPEACTPQIVTRQRRGRKGAFKCLLCGKAYSNQGNLDRHTESHRSKKPKLRYCCRFCKAVRRGLRGIENIRTHIRRAHPKEVAGLPSCPDTQEVTEGLDNNSK